MTIYFYAKQNRQTLKISKRFPCLLFSEDGWNDYGYYILYVVTFYRSATDYVDLGNIKILDAENTDTRLAPQFTELPPDHCSLGQTLEFYQAIKDHLPDDFEQVLRRLNDLVIIPELIDRFRDLEGYQKGLLRFGTAERALNEGQLLLYQGLRKVSDDLKFNYTTHIGNASADHEVEFDFVNNDEMPFRINVLIGKNGTGKTQFLGSMVKAISGVKYKKRSFTPYNPFFNRVIAISYSLFDDFPKFEDTTVFSYRYIGLRTEKEQVVSDQMLEDKLKKALTLIYDDGKAEQWYQLVNQIINLDALGLASADNLQPHWIDKLSYKETVRLSSGQSITLFILTELIAYIVEESLILFDEPETHLHPSAVGELIKVLHQILHDYKSFAIVSTHSPMVIQDVPAKYITVFERDGILPIIRKLPMETFGENISELMNMAFGTIEIKEFYKIWLEQLYKQQFNSIDAIDKIFKDKLSFNAKLYLAAYGQSLTNEES